MTAMQRPAQGMMRLDRFPPAFERDGRRMPAAQHVRPRVLVVDDDQFIRDCVRLALEEEGYEVVAAPDGQAALDYLEGLQRAGQRQPTLILLDMRMPVMDGWEFARRYRNLWVAHAPIVVVTAAADAMRRAEQIEADGVLAKPFDLDELVVLVQRYAQGTRVLGGESWPPLRERAGMMGG